MVKRKLPYSRYSREFREEAVRLVTEGGLSIPEACRRLSIPSGTMHRWVKAQNQGKLEEIGKSQRPASDLEMEVSRLRRELEITRMERDILKKAAAYFAKESMPGTR